jgi:AcrR family transcriptional regulator
MRASSACVVVEVSVHHGSSLSRQYVFVKSKCLEIGVVYNGAMPRLWNETIEAHRRAVHDAILDATAALIDERGLRSVTMSRVAERSGLGRATLYKYFPDVEAILAAWHERHVGGHLERLAQIRDQSGDARERLEAVLGAYALVVHERHATELWALLHREEHVVRARRQLRDLLRDLLTEGAQGGAIRGDVAPDELAGYCLHALAAAGDLASEAAVRRLVGVTLDGLRALR